MLNEYRVRQAKEMVEYARKLRTGAIPLVAWRGKAAAALAEAGVERRSAHLQWDYTLTIWVCDCCMFVHANDECCATDEHGGDSMEPLSAIPGGDTLAMGMMAGAHNSNCTPEDREAGCDCETQEFVNGPCDGCGSFLHGRRHAMTLFVNERRNSVFA